MDSTARLRTRPRLSRRARFSPEHLEGRSLLTGLAFSFNFNDPTNEFGPYPGLMSSLQAAGQVLSGVLDGKGTMDVEVRPDDTIARASGGTAQVTVVGNQGGLQIVENSTLTEARTGVDPNGAAPDVILAINARDYLPTAWFDPSGIARTGPVPTNKLDFITVISHELIHSLGIQGYRTIDGPSIGSFAGTTRTTFDTLTAFGAGGDANTLYFVGANAERVYGGPVPLTSVGANQSLSTQNFYHVGNPTGRPGADLLPDLMNGVVFNYGTRYLPSALDLAILSDLGWTSQSTVRFDAAALSVDAHNSTATVVVTRTGALGTPVSVTYATAPGSAQANVDYTPVTGTLNFAAGEGRKTLTVPITGHALATRSNLVFVVGLGTPTGNGVLGDSGIVPLTILGRAAVAGDYDGDGKADLAVYRAATGQWSIKQSTGGVRDVNFGLPDVDLPVSADFDGDGKMDLAVYRPTDAKWLILYSGGGSKVFQFGMPNVDIPVAADYDGDGKADLAVFRPTTCQWLIYRSRDGAEVMQFGQPNVDQPVVADFDGDGKADLAVVRPTTNQWLIFQSTAGARVVQFGQPGVDLPMVADYDGDGKADLGVFRPTTDTWLILQSTAGGKVIQFGKPGVDVPIPADYDGDGKADLAVYRPPSAQWIVLQTAAGGRSDTFGSVGADLPLLTPLSFRKGNRLRSLA